jgi:hypothetical protein
MSSSIHLINDTDALEMPLSYNKITHFNLQVEYTRKLVKKLKSRDNYINRQSKLSKVKSEKTIKPIKNENEYSEWKNEQGELHRENDLPALTRLDGTKQWWINGKLHRENDKPAIIRSNGVKEWWFNGKPFRKNKKPIIEQPNDESIHEFLSVINKSVQRNKLKM